MSLLKFKSQGLGLAVGDFSLGLESLGSIMGRGLGARGGFS